MGDHSANLADRLIVEHPGEHLIYTVSIATNIERDIGNHCINSQTRVTMPIDGTGVVCLGHSTDKDAFCCTLREIGPGWAWAMKLSVLWYLPSPRVAFYSLWLKSKKMDASSSNRYVNGLIRITRGSQKCHYLSRPCILCLLMRAMRITKEYQRYHYLSRLLQTMCFCFRQKGMLSRAVLTWMETSSRTIRHGI